MTDPQTEITALHAVGKCDCCRRVDALSEWLHRNLDEVPAIGPDSVAAAKAVIYKLKGRVAELEQVLRDVQYKGEYRPAMFADRPPMFDDEPSNWVPTCVVCGTPCGKDCEGDCQIHAALNKESNDGK